MTRIPFDRKLQIFDAVGYKPNAEQWPIHVSDVMVKAIFGGERAGKSYVTAHEGLGAIVPQPEDTHPRRVAIAGQKYSRGHAEFRYMSEALHKLGLVRGKPSTPKVGRRQLDTTAGGILETVSFEDGAKELTGTGQPYDAVLVVEAGLVSENPIEGAFGRVAETDGLVLLSGTLQDNLGWYNELGEVLQGPNEWDGVMFSLPSWANTVIFPGGRNDRMILKWEVAFSNIPGAFARRVAGEVVPSPARYYPEFDLKVHVRENLDYDIRHPVYLTIDPGYFPKHYSVLALQIGMNERLQESVYVVDEIYANHKIHEAVIDECTKRAWWGDHIRAVYCGHEGKGHHYDKSTAEVWTELTGMQVTITDKPATKDNEEMRVHSFLRDYETGLPRLFVAKRCLGLIQEIRKWKRKTDSNHTVVSSEPAPGLFCDSLDALTNFLLARYGLVDLKKLSGRAGRQTTGAKG